MIENDHIRIEDVTTVMVGNVVRDAHGLTLARPMSADDVADRIGMSNFGEYALNYVLGPGAQLEPNAEGRYGAVLIQLSDGDEEDDGTW